MGTERTFGIRMTADGKQLVGEVRISREELEKLGVSTGKANSEAEKLNASNKSLSSSYGSLSTVVKAVAASYVVLKVAQYAQEAALLAARYETLGVSMQVVGNNAGYTTAQMDEAAVGMQNMGISMIESRQQALRMVQANISLSESSKLARIAQDAAVIGNMNSSQAFATMIHGIQTGQTDVLRTIGLNISMEQSYKAYAATLGKSANELTQAEKMQAILNAVMKEGAGIAGIYESAMGTAAKQINSLERYHENLKVVMGSTFTEALAAAVGAYTGELKDLSLAAQELKIKGDLQLFARGSAVALAAMGDGVRDVSNTVIIAASSIAILGAATARIGTLPGSETWKQLGQDMKNLRETQAEAFQGLLGDTHKLQNATIAMFDNIDAKAQASADKRLATETDYISKAQAVAAAYAGSKYQVPALQALADSYGGDIKAAHGSPKGTDPTTGTSNAVKEYDKLIAKLKGDLVGATAAAEAAQNGYNKEQVKALELFASPEWAKMSEKQRILAAGLTEATIAQSLQIDARAKAKKATEDFTKAEQEYMSAIGKETESLLEKASTAELENAMIGMTAEQLVQLTGQRYDEQIAIKSAYADTLRGIEGREAELHMIEQQVVALGKLKNAEITRPALQASAEAWKNFTRDIESSLTDALMRGFEAGNGFGENFVDALRNTLKTAALKVVVQAIVDPVMGGVRGALGGGSSLAGGSSASGGALGYVNAGQTLWSAFSGGMASGMGSLAMSAGEMFGSTALAQFGGGASIVGAGGTAAQVSAAAGSGSAAGIGATVATAMPYIAAAYVAYSLLKGNGGTPTANTGNASMQFDASGQRTGMQTYYGGSSATTDSIITGMQTSYMQAAAALGIGTVASQFHQGGNTGKNGQSPNFALGGGAGGVNFYQGETPLSEAAIQLAASRAVFAALQGSQLPQYLKGVFSGMTAGAMTQQQIDDTLAYAAALKQVHDGMNDTRTVMVGMSETLADGMAALHTSAATFERDFLAAINNGVTPDVLARWQRLGQQIGEVAGYISQTQISSMTTLLGLADRMAALNLSDLSPLTAADRLATAGGQYATLLAQARAGDMNAVGNLGGAAQAYLQEGRSYYSSSQDYTALYDSVQGAVGEFVGNQLTDNAIAITDLKVPLEAIVSNTQNLDKRIADMLAAALAVRAETDAAVIRAQTEAIVRATLDAARVTVSAQQAGALA